MLIKLPSWNTLAVQNSNPFLWYAHMPIDEPALNKKPMGRLIFAFACDCFLFFQQLLKSKVQQDDSSCKVGIRIRANPSNSRALTQLAIVIVIPPDLNGYSVQMSRKGGQWDDMKRTLSWTLDRLAPGDAIDMQAIFANVQNGNPTERRFPILLQCRGDELFSKVEAHGNTVEEPSQRLRLDVAQLSTVLFRKV
jgi:hypothetical protein